MLIECEYEGCGVKKHSTSSMNDHKYLYHHDTYSFLADGVFCEIKRKEDGFKCLYCESILKNIATLSRHLKQLHSKISITKTKKRDSSAFSFEEGCYNAMNVHTDSEKKKRQCVFHAKSRNYEPIRFEIYRQLEGKVTAQTSAYAFMDSEVAVSLSRIIQSHQNSDKSLDTRISFCSEESDTFSSTKVEKPTLYKANTNNSTSNTIETLQLAVRNSSFPQLMQVLGPFEELDDDLQNKLNIELRCYPDMLKQIPKLFVGSIIYTGYSALLIILCESYDRSAEIDIHMESSGESLPTTFDSKQRYSGLTCNKIKQSDGGKSVDKLILGTDSFNILCTSSLVIFPEKEKVVHVGPAVDDSSCLTTISKAQIFFSKSKIKQFLDWFEHKDNSQDVTLPNINNLRQLTSYYNHHSTYQQQRASLFNDITVMPVMTFTLCSLPPSEGYGIGVKSEYRFISHFLQLCAIACLTNNNKLTSRSFNSFYDQYSVYERKPFQNWKVQDDAIRKMKSKMDESHDNEVNVPSFFDKENVCSLASIPSASISKTNHKISSNLMAKLSKLFN